MPPTSGLSLRRDVAERIFPLPLEAPLVSCPDQLITRLAPLLTNVTREEQALSEYRLHGGNNYGPDRVTAASFKRELEYCEALWWAQRRFLETSTRRLAEDFQPLSLHPYIVLYELTSTLVSPGTLMCAAIMIATWPAPAGARDWHGFGSSRFTCLTQSSISPSISWFGRAGSSR